MKESPKRVSPLYLWGPVIVVSLLVLWLSGCNSYNTRPNETTGMLVGAGLGGLVGSQVGSGTGQLAATAIGVLIGSQLGASVGRSMDQQDRMLMNRALEDNRTRTTTAWRNPDTRHQYRVTPTKTYTAPMHDGHQTYCREFTLEHAKIGGQPQQIYGTACRQPDGAWKVQ